MNDFFYNLENIRAFWNKEDDKNFFDNNFYSVNDNSKYFYNESLDSMMILTYKGKENSSQNNQIFNKYELPETFTEKKTTTNLTNNSPVCFSYGNIINIFKKLNDKDFNGYITLLENCIKKPELKEIEYEMKLLKKKRKKYEKKKYE